MQKTTIYIILVGIALLLFSSFGYWKSEPYQGLVAEYLQQTDLTVYTNRAVDNSRLSTIDQSLAKADALCQKEAYLKAIGLLQMVLEQDAGNTEVHLRLGICYLQQDRQNIAQEHLQRAFEDQTSVFRADAAWFLALIELQLKEKQEAQDFLKIAIEERGNYHKAAKDLLAKLN